MENIYYLKDKMEEDSHVLILEIEPKGGGGNVKVLC